jgi:hypothetical protein
MEENHHAQIGAVLTNYKLFETGNSAIKFCAYAYGIYALFLLFECVDFLALLHTDEPGFHATYSIVHVAFFIVELIVCASLTLGFLLLLVTNDKMPLKVVFIVLIITILRAGFIYYLYWQTEPKVHFIPYIYKKANDFSGIARGILLPLQVIGGIVCTWVWVGAARRSSTVK